MGNELVSKLAHVSPIKLFPCADCRILLEARVVREKALFDFQNPAEFIQLAVGKKPHS